MEAARTEYAEKNELPLWARILSVPSNILGREAFTSGLEGAGKGYQSGGVLGAIGGFLGGAVEGEIDAVTHAFGLVPGMDVTNFRDIRKAFGDTSTDEGLSDFAIDLLGDIATDPAIWLNPLGFLKKGVTSAQMAAQGRTLQNQVLNGLRGGIVFRVPIFGETGFDVMEGLAKLPLPYFDKFKSLNVQFAKGMDHLYGTLRTSPLLGPMLQKFGAVPIKDPEQAASLKAAMIGANEKWGIFEKSWLERYNRLPDDMKELMTNSEHGKAVIDVMETGMVKIDQRGRLLDYVKRLPQVMRNNEFRAAWKKDDTLRGLWRAAAHGDEAESVAAIKKLYDDYDYRLPKQWLDDAGKAPRPGIEFDPEDTMAGAIGKALAGSRVSPTGMEVDRGIQTAIARGAGEVGQEGFRAAQAEARVARVQKLWQEVDNGTIKQGDLEGLLSLHKDAMEAVADADRVSKAINGTLESYFPRIMSPAVRKFIDKQQIAVMSKMGLGTSFGKHRLLTGMSTTEASEFLMKVGSKITNYEGLGKSVETFKRELAEHGPWAVLNAIYPKAFVNKLNRIDEEMGSFFLTNPILADQWRIKASVDISRRSEFMRAAFAADSPLVLDAANLADPIAAMSVVQAAGQNKWKLMLVGEKGTLPQPVGKGEIVTDAIGKDLRARVATHEHRVSQELDKALDDVTTPFDTRLDELVNVQKINNKSALQWTDQTPYSEMTLKRAVKGKLDARQKLTVARGALSELTDARVAPIKRDIDALAELIDSDKARLKMLADGPVDWKEIDTFNREVSERVEKIMAGETALSAARTAKRGVQKEDVFLRQQERVLEAAAAFNKAHAEEMSIRAAIKHTVDNLKIARREVTAGKEAAIAGERAALRTALQGARDAIKPEMISNEAKLWYRFRKNGTLGWDELSPDAQARALKNGKGGTLIATHQDTLDNVTRYWETFNAPDSMRGTMFARVMDPLRRWFVGMTVMHPAMVNTRMADVMGGSLVAAQGGYFSPGNFITAERWSRKVGHGIKNSLPLDQVLATEEFVSKAGQRFNAGQLLSEFQRGGLIASDFVRDSLIGIVQDAAVKNRSTGRQMMDWALGTFGLAKPQTNPVIRLGGKFARYGDDTVRIQTALSALDKGMDVPSAIREAIHWTYGAGKDLTAFERNVAKRFLPFYGFMSWSMRRMAELWLHKPGTVSWLGHVRDNAYEANNLDPADTNKILPKFVNDNLGIPIATTAEGPKMYLFGKLFPMGNVFDMVSAVTAIVTGHPSEAVRYIGNNMHPALKNAAELVVNRDFFAGREISHFPGDTSEFLGVDMPAPMKHVLRTWFRGLSELDRLNVFNADEMTVAIDAVRRDDVLGRRAELPAIERWLSSAFGPVPVKGYAIDIEEDLRYTRRKDQERLSKNKAQLRKSLEEGKQVEVEAMQSVVSDSLAEIEARQRMASRFLIDETQASKKKIRLVR